MHLDRESTVLRSLRSLKDDDETQATASAEGFELVQSQNIFKSSGECETLLLRCTLATSEPFRGRQAYTLGKDSR